MMEKDLWIKESGRLTEEELIGNMAAYSACYTFFTAFMTDGMLCGKAAELTTLQQFVSTLLEVRLFSREAELWLHRSMLGSSFMWRLADDQYLEEVCKNTGALFAGYRFEILQMLDVDTKHAPEGRPKLQGNRLLRTTGGGVYELPVGNEDAVRLVCYVGYSADGVAKITDFRLKEFAHMNHNRPGGAEIA